MFEHKEVNVKRNNKTGQFKLVAPVVEQFAPFAAIQIALPVGPAAILHSVPQSDRK